MIFNKNFCIKPNKYSYIYAKEYCLISTEKFEFTGSKLLMNILIININYNKLLYKYMKNSNFIINKLSKLLEQGLIFQGPTNELLNILR